MVLLFARFIYNLMKVFDGYSMVEAIPPKENYIILDGDGSTEIPPSSYIWLVGQGTTGWWSCDHLKTVGQLMKNEYTYAIKL